MNIMCEVNPEQKNVCKENGLKSLFLRLPKDFYGCMESVLLWYGLYKKH